MRRREFLAGLGSAAAWSVVARAQQTAMPVIGFLFEQSADDYKNFTIGFLQSLKETGYVEGGRDRSRRRRRRRGVGSQRSESVLTMTYPF
jgi:hypothetical protein